MFYNWFWFRRFAFEDDVLLGEPVPNRNRFRRKNNLLDYEEIRTTKYV